MLLILTSDKDLTADFLISELIDRKLPYFRINAEELVNADMSFYLADAEFRRHLVVGPRILDLKDIKSVWYRRVVQPIPPAILPSSERAFVAGEFRHLAMGLVLDPSALWVNPIDKVSIAEHKLYQLRVARACGFRVPRTLVSSDIDKLRHFSESNDTGTICKPIFHGLFSDGSSRYSIYTRRVTKDMFDAHSVSICPVLLQEEVPRIADVRVTIIGEECFVAEITGDAGLVDWRDTEISVDYSPAEIDSATYSACRTMLEQLGLKYGAFDFIKTPDGNLVFLEVNPTGEWAWLENRLGFPMREAFIRLMYGVPR